MTKEELYVDEEYNGLRIDKYISVVLDELSRSYVQKLLKDEHILVRNIPVKANYKVHTKDCICVLMEDSVVPDIVPENIPLDILFEDKDIIIINKPKGMVVHPASGHYTGTLVNALMYHCADDLSGINGVMRPGIVHRIDMNTTGSIIACKNDFSHNHIAAQLKAHTILRKYRAIVHGIMKEDEGSVNLPIGRHPNDRKKMSTSSRNGKEAVTHYKVLQRFRNYTYIECYLETGRTHQIRVHMAYLHHPLLGDDVYSGIKAPYKLQGQVLHAMTLGIIHPRTGEYMEFEAPIPDYFNELLSKLPQ